MKRGQEIAVIKANLYCYLHRHIDYRMVFVPVHSILNSVRTKKLS